MIRTDTPQETEAAQVGPRVRGELFHAVLQTVAALVVITDRTGRIVFLNRECERTTGYSEKELLGNRLWEVLLPPEDAEQAKQLVQSLQPDAAPCQHESDLLSKDGPRRRVAWTNSCLFEPDGRPRYLIHTGIDITARTRAEQERDRHLREAEEAVRVREDFLSIASHELKTPLTPLSLRLQVLEQQAGAGQPVEPEMVKAARRSLARLSTLVGDLLDASRIATGRLMIRRQPLDFRALVQETVTLFAASCPSHPVLLEEPEQPLMVLGNEERLEQVLENLLENAAKYSPEGSSIRVKLEASPGQLTLSVMDQGIGLAPDQQRYLFERFYRARNARSAPGGLGLGLYIARDIVERHEGKIWAQSQPLKGTTFYVSLPLTG